MALPHDGSARTLEEAMEVFHEGGTRNPDFDPKIKPLKLKKQEKADLVEFMNSARGGPAGIEMPALPQSRLTSTRHSSELAPGERRDSG